MPRTTTRKTAPKPAAAKAAASEVIEEANANVGSIEDNKEAEKKAYRVKKDLPLDMIVTVRNGFNGKLVYKSSKTNERFVWDTFGDEQDMELRELKNARNAQKGYFINNWFLIDDWEVIEYLGVERFYKNALSYEEFDSLFDLSAPEIGRRIATLSDGQKVSVRYRAKQLISEGVIDSIKVINTLEKSLGVELIER